MDIVYIVKESYQNEELRYSLRSLKNLSGIKRVWIVGYKPAWVKNVVYLPVKQHSTKWENASELYTIIANTNAISNKFVLFNDDFFILKPMNEVPIIYDRTIEKRIDDFREKGMYPNSYTLRIQRTSDRLKAGGYSAKNYETHTPMIFEKAKLKEVIDKYKGLGAKRSLYGNYWNIGGQNKKDVKIYDKTSKARYNQKLVSTSDSSFNFGEIGRQIKALFPDKCIYEL